MRHLRNIGRLAAGAMMLFAVSGCAILQNLASGDLPGAAASIGDTLVTPAVHAPIANSALAAENLYSGAQEILTTALKDHVITKAQALTLDPLVDKVYGVVVQIRAVQQGQDVSAVLKSFNGAFGDLFTAAKKVGVTLPTATTGDVP